MKGVYFGFRPFPGVNTSALSRQDGPAVNQIIIGLQKNIHMNDFADVSLTFAAQCRAARGLLNWSRDDLAERAEISLQQVIDYETTGPRSQAMTALLRETFESAGIQFIMGEESFGVTLQPR
jgi:hypothetical protein